MSICGVDEELGRTCVGMGRSIEGLGKSICEGMGRSIEGLEKSICEGIGRHMETMEGGHLQEKL